MDDGEHADVAERKGGAGEPGPPFGELLFHAPEDEDHVVQRGLQLLGGIATLGQQPPSLALLRDRRVRQHDLLFRLAQPFDLRLQHMGMGEASQRQVNLVRGPGPIAHPRPLLEIGGAQRRFGKRVFDIFVDAERIDDRRAVMDERRHHAVRIELEIVGAQILVPPKLDIAAFVSQALLAQAVAHLLGAGRQSAVIELQHRPSRRGPSHPGSSCRTHRARASRAWRGALRA